MLVDEVINNIHVCVNFDKKVSLLCDVSGTGKTLLLKLLSYYFKMNEIRYIKIDSSMGNYDKDAIVALCKGCRYVLLDNADLYLTNEMLREIKKNKDCQIVISIKNTGHIDSGSDTGHYAIDFDGQILSPQRYW